MSPVVAFVVMDIGPVLEGAVSVATGPNPDCAWAVYQSRRREPEGRASRAMKDPG
ncbi:MAG TPA: hypothetical protein VKF17_05575 [Isosphaeraceae bacterium]|nr:hypothetical protein [Isosphaeraceae bacterium]